MRNEIALIKISLKIAKKVLAERKRLLPLPPRNRVMEVH
jgi:hypothetical protein